MYNDLNILYTANLQGKIELLPRLQSFIRQLKALPLDEGDDVMICAVQPVARSTFLLDLGNFCSPDVWHCAATEGRSVLIALDAMGYQAANISGALTSEARARTHDNLLGITLVDENNTYEDNGILITADDKKGGIHSRPNLHIVLTPSAETCLKGNQLYLASVQAGQVGVVHIGGLNSYPAIQSHTIFDLPPTIAPDPTIAGAVEFVLSEARMYERKNEGQK